MRAQCTDASYASRRVAAIELILLPATPYDGDDDDRGSLIRLDRTVAEA